MYEKTGQADKQDFMKVTPESLVGLTKVLKFSQSFLTLKNAQRRIGVIRSINI